MLNYLGRALMLGIWGFLLFNLIQPFPSPLTYFLDVALIFMALMHGFQLLLLKSTQPKDSPPLSRWSQLQFFIFGVFALLSWQKKQSSPTNNRR